MKTITAIGLILLMCVPVLAAEEQDAVLPVEPGTLPDSPFYGLKKAAESLGNVFAFGAEKKAERSLMLAERRLAEAEAMVLKGKPEFVDSLTEEYGAEVAKAIDIADASSEAERGRIIETVSTATARHIEALDAVEARVPEVAKEKIAAARKLSIRGNQEALKALAEEDPEKAAEIAMDVASKRVEKARAAAEKGNSQTAEDSAEEYKEYAQFGATISAIAQQAGKNSSMVPVLVKEATSIHKTVLQDVYERVPEQAKPSIGTAIEKAETGQTKAIEALEQRREMQGKQGDTDETEPSEGEPAPPTPPRDDSIMATPGGTGQQTDGASQTTGISSTGSQPSSGSQGGR